MKLLKEPLVYFLLAGGLIFLLDAGGFSDDETKLIDVSDAQIRRISDQWQGQMGRPPTAEELDGLLEQWLREEIYYREARAMGLEANDTIIRRRLAQKLTFLSEDLADADDATDAELLAFYDQAPESYTQPEQFTFEHRYFSSDRRVDARTDAVNARNSNESKGDPFMLQLSYAGRTQREIGDLFGREFAEELSALAVADSWQGPLRSAYGWHLVRLSHRQPERLLPFTEVADRVGQDFKLARRQSANEELYQTLRAGYEIRYPAAAQ